jgi:predicted small lipoprotein YifL
LPNRNDGAKPLKLVPAFLACALTLTACGAKPLELPADPVDRAATCGVVAAAAARTAVPDVKAPLPLAAQGKIFHYALLAASQSGAFEAETANRVNKRMRDLEAGITGGKWRDLVPACDSAFPVAAKADVSLPSGSFQAQMVCEELADFTSVALEGSEIHFGNELAAYRRMRTELNDAVGPGLRARAGSSIEAQTRERNRALAEATALGSPIPVLDKCRERFK